MSELLSNDARRRLARLIERVTFLESRSAKRAAEGVQHTREDGEASALRWAIDFIRGRVAPSSWARVQIQAEEAIERAKAHRQRPPLAEELAEVLGCRPAEVGDRIKAVLAEREELRAKVVALQAQLHEERRLALEEVGHG